MNSKVATELQFITPFSHEDSIRNNLVTCYNCDIGHDIQVDSHFVSNNGKMEHHFQDLFLFDLYFHCRLYDL